MGLATSSNSRPKIQGMDTSGNVLNDLSSFAYWTFLAWRSFALVSVTLYRIYRISRRPKVENRQQRSSGSSAYRRRSPIDLGSPADTSHGSRSIPRERAKSIVPFRDTATTTYCGRRLRIVFIIIFTRFLFALVRFGSGATRLSARERERDVINFTRGRAPPRKG